MKLERLLAMLFILIEHKTIRAQDLADRFEVSLRTIYRDVDTLSAAGIPIYTNQGRNGGICIMEGYVINKSILSKEEQAHIVASLKSMKAVGQKESQMSEKLGSFFHSDVQNWIRVDFSSWQKEQQKTQNFTLLKEAILNHKQVSFVYYSMQDKKTKRFVEPHQIVYKGQDWYLYGYCLTREAFRYFKLTRIKDLEMLPRSFTKRAMEMDDEVVYEESLIPLKLRIEKAKQYRILDELMAFVVEETDAYVIVEMEMSEHWLYEYIFSYQEHVEVLEPLTVRSEVMQKLANLQKKYKSD